MNLKDIINGHCLNRHRHYWWIMQIRGENSSLFSWDKERQREKQRIRESDTQREWMEWSAKIRERERDRQIDTDRLNRHKVKQQHTEEQTQTMIGPELQTERKRCRQLNKTDIDKRTDSKSLRGTEK